MYQVGWYSQICFGTRTMTKRNRPIGEKPSGFFFPSSCPPLKTNNSFPKIDKSREKKIAGPICSVYMLCLFCLKIWWQCASNFPTSGTCVPTEFCSPWTCPTFTVLQWQLNIALSHSLLYICGLALFAVLCVYTILPGLRTWQMSVVESCWLLRIWALCAPKFEWQ